jgi:hypothetical protein
VQILTVHFGQIVFDSHVDAKRDHPLALDSPQIRNCMHGYYNTLFPFSRCVKVSHHTLSPSWKCLLAWGPASICFSCFTRTRSETSGFSIDSRVLTWRPKNSSDGVCKSCCRVWCISVLQQTPSRGEGRQYKQHPCCCRRQLSSALVLDSQLHVWRIPTG